MAVKRIGDGELIETCGQQNNYSKCENEALELHLCPFRQDVHGDEVTQCNCCSECQYQCVMDI